MFVAFRKYAPRLPGVLIGVAILTAVSALSGFAERGGRVVGSIPAGLPGVGVPALEWGAITALLPAAFVIALISFMEAMSSCKAIAIKTRVRWDENQELVGQGFAKIAAAFCQSMPVSGSFSRSALNLASGARTGLSSLVTAACVLLTLLFFTPLLYHLPKPVLAAVIMLAVIGLLDLGAFRRSWRASREDGVAAIATFVATLAFAPNIQNGILTGIIVSLAAYMYGRMRPEIEARAVPATDAVQEGGRGAAPAAHATIGTLRFDAALYFANVSFFEETVLALEREESGSAVHRGHRERDQSARCLGRGDAAPSDPAPPAKRDHAGAGRHQAAGPGRCRANRARRRARPGKHLSDRGSGARGPAPAQGRVRRDVRR